MNIKYVNTNIIAKDCKSYEKTRLFYKAMGFKPLEVFKNYWDENDPCLFMVNI
ncbi:MAG TPA: hypothetical protein GXX37_03665 [Clostridiaceae bacterium]|nr:hypothetical protein [Clostridiaceae bacterium]